MANFNGTWKLIKVENFEAYLDALGDIPADLKAKTVAALSPSNDVRQELALTADGYTVKSITPLWTKEQTAKFGEAFEETSPGGKQITVVVTKDGDKLVEQQTGPYTSSNSRQIVGENMVYTMVANGVTSTRTYKRV